MKAEKPGTARPPARTTPLVINPWRRLPRKAATFALLSVGLVSVLDTGGAAGSATHDGMEVTGAFLPLPASPSVASAYLVLHNLTGRADTLISCATALASRTTAMSEDATTMQPLGPVRIPPHGRLVFTPGHDHLMLQGMRRTLRVGEDVELRLRFRHAGTLEVKVPVVPLDRIIPGGSGKGVGEAGPPFTTAGYMEGL